MGKGIYDTGNADIITLILILILSLLQDRLRRLSSWWARVSPMILVVLISRLVVTWLACPGDQNVFCFLFFLVQQIYLFSKLLSFYLILRFLYNCLIINLLCVFVSAADVQG